MLAKTSVRKRFAVRRGEGVEFKGRKKSYDFSFITLDKNKENPF